MMLLALELELELRRPMHFTDTHWRPCLSPVIFLRVRTWLWYGWGKHVTQEFKPWSLQLHPKLFPSLLVLKAAGQLILSYLCGSYLPHGKEVFPSKHTQRLTGYGGVAGRSKVVFCVLIMSRRKVQSDLASEAESSREGRLRVLATLNWCSIQSMPIGWLKIAHNDLKDPILSSGFREHLPIRGSTEHPPTHPPTLHTNK